LRRAALVAQLALPLAAAWAVALAATPLRAESPLPFTRTEEREPCAEHDPLRQPFFGDTHVHTALSFDAFGQGTLARPDDAYRYAQGHEIGIQPYDREGRPLRRIQLRRPLDYAVVTDHSELLGETQICQLEALEGYDSTVCRVMRRFPKLGYMLVNGLAFSDETPERFSFCLDRRAACREAGRGPWQEIQEAAEAHYDRSAACRFTTFVGYEWSGMPGGYNIHRNVIFRNATVQRYPTNYIDTPTQEGLWHALETECLAAGHGCDVLAIPHNSNVSGGRLFTITRPDGTPISAEDARTRARLERLVEVIQHKGDSECRPGAPDELCDDEKLRYPRLMDMVTTRMPPEDLPPRIYVREVLTEGLVQSRRTGVNPFRFGLIGASDTHFAAPGMVDEDAYVGHAAGTVDARFGIPAYPDRPDFNPGGLGVLWAEENSRDALFEAMRRREAYGTSGPRMTLRFFGGWDYGTDWCSEPDPARRAARGYARGVPMGGTLPQPPAGEAPRAPRFAIWAQRDPGGYGTPSTPLQRIQIVKGSLVAGEGHERVYDVAGDPGSDADVDLATCTPRGRGFDSLCRVWTDPDFDPTSPAFYYARVVENPSCRWNTWVCNARGVDCSHPRSVPRELRRCCDPEAPKTIQERAWSSPIWYTPFDIEARAAAPGS
jgi:hypothetical protein